MREKIIVKEGNMSLLDYISLLLFTRSRPILNSNNQCKITNKHIAVVTGAKKLKR